MLNVRDAGALGQGTDDTREFQEALNSGSKGVYVPAGTYVISQTLTPPADIVIALDKAAVIRPTMGTHLLRRSAPPPTNTTAVTEGARLGSDVVTVGSPNGFAKGQDVRFAATPGPFPPSWNRIKAVEGRRVTLEEPLPVSYQGSLTMSVQPMHQDFRLFGGTIDLTATPSAAAPGLVAIDGYRSAEVEGVTFRGPVTTRGIMGLVALAGNRRATINNCHAEDVVCYAQAFGISGSKLARISNCTIDGDCFGTYMGANDYDETQHIMYTGRRKPSDENFSVRAVKTEGSRHSIIDNVIASNCETVIQWYNSGRGRVSNIVGVNIGLTRYRGQTAINIASSTKNGELNTIGVSGVVLENLGGVGIQVSGDIAGRIILSDINIKRCHAYAIIAEALYLSVGPAVIEEWNLGGIEGVPAVYSTIEAGGAAMAFHDLIFLHSNPRPQCFSIRKGPQYKLSNLAAADGNPLNID